MSGAILRRRDRTNRPLGVAHNPAAVDTCPRRLVQVECQCIAGSSAKLGGPRSVAEPGGQLGMMIVSGGRSIRAMPLAS